MLPVYFLSLRCFCSFSRIPIKEISFFKFFVVYIRDKFDFSRYLFIKAGDAKLEAQNPVAPQPKQRRFASI